MTDDLLQAVRDLPKVCRYIHVPAQSGCDLVLKRMKRMYTVAFYEEMLARIRATVPDVAVSSDFIVGFCGEDEASFERTVRLVERSRFKNSFIFKYSPRRGDQGRRALCRRRARGGQEAAEQRAARLAERDQPGRQSALVGRTVEVLVEGPSKKTARREGWEGWRPVDGPDALRSDRGVRGARAADRPSSCRSWSKTRARSLCSAGWRRSERDRDSGVKGRTYDGRLARGPGELLDRVGWDRRCACAGAGGRSSAGFPATARSVPAGRRPAVDRRLGGAARLSACRTGFRPG